MALFSYRLLIAAILLLWAAPPKQRFFVHGLFVLPIPSSSSNSCCRLPPRHGGSPFHTVLSAASSSSVAKADTTDDDLVVEQIRAMRVKEIKAELAALRISSADAFEKEELVQRLFQARQKSSSDDDDNARNIIRGPLYFTCMDAGTRIPAGNDDAHLTINPSEQPYATIQVEGSSSLGREDFTLSLLLDTACSGLLLRPSVVERYNLPKYSNPVSMTGAGGTLSDGVGLTQLHRIAFGRRRENDNDDTSFFGPMPAAVQDIGGLPSSLDGIIGLSFLNQFACVELDFREGMLTLYKTERRPAIPEGLQVVAEAEMSPTRLGIWTADVTMDGRGPVKMLVDSGAAHTFLNWKGVEDLSLSRTSPLIRPTPVPTGAMGSDNNAMALTHRLVLEKNVNIGRRPSHNGLDILVGDDDGINVDIGDIAVLDTLRQDGVGGILGIDVMMRCAMARMTFNGPVQRLTLLN